MLQVWLPGMVMVMMGSWEPGLPELHPGRSVWAKPEVSHHGSCPSMGSWAAALHSARCMSVSTSSPVSHDILGLAFRRSALHDGSLCSR